MWLLFCGLLLKALTYEFILSYKSQHTSPISHDNWIFLSCKTSTLMECFSVVVVLSRRQFFCSFELIANAQFQRSLSFSDVID